MSGHGGERDLVEHYRASSIVLEFREKVRIEMAVSEPFVEPTINAILAAARTGEVGDGKIFVQPLERVIRIRTGETDNAALTPVTADEVQRQALQASAALSQVAIALHRRVARPDRSGAHSAGPSAAPHIFPAR